VNLNSTLIIQCLVFFALAWFTMTFVWPPLIKALDERRAKIAEGLSAADKGKESFKEAQIAIGKLEASARQEAAEIKAQAEKTGQALIDEAKAQAKAEGERLFAAAKAEIEQEANRARTALRDQVAALAVAGAEQILRKEVNAQAHADLLAQLKAQL